MERKARKNIVVTTNLGGDSGSICEYDFDDRVVRKDSCYRYKEQSNRNIGFRASSDITQTYSSAQAIILLDAIQKGEHYELVEKRSAKGNFKGNYEEVKNKEGNIVWVFEANVPSPFLDVK